MRGPIKIRSPGLKFFDGITDNPFTGTFGNKAQLEFLVIVPVAFIYMILEYSNEERFFGIQFNLFQ